MIKGKTVHQQDVYIISLEGRRLNYPILGYINNSDEIEMWDRRGKHTRYKERDLHHKTLEEVNIAIIKGKTNGSN